MIEELVGRVFATRNAAHLAHWRTDSYAQHQALGEFYSSIIDKIDTIIEMYQGAFDLVEKTPSQNVSPKNLIAHLTSEAEWIEENLDQLSSGVKSIENALQDLSGIYYKTIYKLTHLQ